RCTHDYAQAQRSSAQAIHRIVHKARKQFPGQPEPAAQVAGHQGYRWERRGRNLIQAKAAMATTSSHGENRMGTVKLRTASATRTMRARAMIASMMIGLRSRKAVCGPFTLQAAAGGGFRRSGSAPVRTLVCAPKASGSSLTAAGDAGLTEADGRRATRR